MNRLKRIELILLYKTWKDFKFHCQQAFQQSKTFNNEEQAEVALFNMNHFNKKIEEILVSEINSNMKKIQKDVDDME